MEKKNVKLPIVSPYAFEALHHATYHLLLLDKFVKGDDLKKVSDAFGLLVDVYNSLKEQVKNEKA